MVDHSSFAARNFRSTLAFLAAVVEQLTRLTPVQHKTIPAILTLLQVSQQPESLRLMGSI